MPDKNIGFSRTVHLDWLDATASLRLQTDDPQLIRRELELFLESYLSGKDARRKTIDVLLGIWVKSAASAPDLRKAALKLFQNAYTSDDHLWVHYGLALIYYPIFRYVIATIGQLSRLSDSLTRNQIKAQVAAEWGHLGALDRSVERICASLTEWGLFPQSEKKNEYRAARRELQTSNPQLEIWLLACALHAHPAEAILATDLLRLPELFPFDLQVTVRDLKQSHWFTVQREGGWEMVRLDQDFHVKENF